jgi:hypothetical protein
LDVLLQVRLEIGLRGCCARARGCVRMDDVVCTPARVRLWVSEGRRRTLRVRIRFVGPDSARYRLDGCVRVDRRSLAWSTTRLHGPLWRGHRPIGLAELRFDLRRGLLGVLRSVRLAFVSWENN